MSRYCISIYSNIALNFFFNNFTLLPHIEFVSTNKITLETKAIDLYCGFLKTEKYDLVLLPLNLILNINTCGPLFKSAVIVLKSSNFTSNSIMNECTNFF